MHIQFLQLVFRAYPQDILRLVVQAHSIAPLLDPEISRDAVEDIVQAVLASKGVDCSLDPHGSLAAALVGSHLMAKHVRVQPFPMACYRA